MRLAGLALLGVFAAGCGEQGPAVTVTQEPRPKVDPSAARADALAAARAFEQVAKEYGDGGADFGREAKLVLELAERLQGSDAKAAYESAHAAYVTATEECRAARTNTAVAAKQAQEELYQETVRLRAEALAARTQIDTARLTLAGRVAQAEGWEKDVYKKIQAHCEAEVFSGKQMLAIDTKLETAKAHFESQRYADAKQEFGAAKLELEKIKPLCETVSWRFLALAVKDRAKAAEERIKLELKAQRLPPPPSLANAEKAARAGRDKFRNGDFKGASKDYEEARRAFAEELEDVPLLVAARDEAERTYRAARAAKQAWEKYAQREGLDPKKGAEAAEAAFKRGDALAKKGAFAEATRECRAARAAFEKLADTTRDDLEERLKALQKGPAPEPVGMYPSAQHRRAVARGLDWLRRHQDEDGRWDSDGFRKHDPADDQCDGPGQPLYDVGLSGLALLAFLEAGFTDRGDHPVAYYALNIHRGLKYLLLAQDEHGVFGTRATTSFMYNHLIATKAMCEAYGRTKNEAYRKSAQRALAWIANARNPDLAWRYEPRGTENDTSVTLWAVQALDAGRRAGLEVDAAAFDGALEWVDKMTDPNFGQVGYQYPGGPPARPEGMQDKFPPEKSQSMTAAGMLVRILCGQTRGELFRKGMALCVEQPPTWNPDDGSIDLYYWYLAQRVMTHPAVNKHYKHRAVRRAWEKFAHPAILRHQHPTGSGARTGSWDPIGVWGVDGGRIYSTAIVTLALVPYPEPPPKKKK